VEGVIEKNEFSSHPRSLLKRRALRPIYGTLSIFASHENNLQKIKGDESQTHSPLL
jgi:hypothetical protein